VFRCQLRRAAGSAKHPAKSQPGIPIETRHQGVIIVILSESSRSLKLLMGSCMRRDPWLLVNYERWGSPKWRVAVLPTREPFCHFYIRAFFLLMAQP